MAFYVDLVLEAYCPISCPLWPEMAYWEHVDAIKAAMREAERNAMRMAGTR